MLWFPALIIAAMTGAPSVLPAPGSRAAYRYVFTGHFWNGALVSADRTDVLEHTADGLELTKRDSASDRTTQSRGMINPDGTVSLVDRSAASDPFTPYNAVALLLRGAGSYDSGAKWNASLAVQTGETAAGVTHVPVTVEVAQIDGDVVTIQGSGATSAISTYGDYTNPIDLTIALAARFAGGALQRADYKATEYVHAGPLSQTMTWSWSLSVEAAASNGLPRLTALSGRMR